MSLSGREGKEQKTRGKIVGEAVGEREPDERKETEAGSEKKETEG
jgi:hypothetical protein